MSKKHHFLRYGAYTLVAALVAVALYTFWAPVATTVASGYEHYQSIRTGFNPPAPVAPVKGEMKTTDVVKNTDGRTVMRETTTVDHDTVAEIEQLKKQLADASAKAKQGIAAAEASAQTYAAEQTKKFGEQFASLKAEIAKAKAPAPAPVAASAATPAPAVTSAPVPQEQSALPPQAATPRYAANQHIVTPDNASASDIALMAEAYRINGKVPGGQKLGGFADIPRDQGFTCPSGRDAGKPAKLVASKDARSGRLVRRWACHN